MTVLGGKVSGQEQDDHFQTHRSDLDEAVARLGASDVVGLPTETVYGLAADATDDDAVAKIFRLKGRPADHPLIVHMGDPGWLERYCVFRSETMRRDASTLARHFWPGPLTLVLPKADVISSRVTGDLSTVAVRVPDHPMALAVLRRLDRPLAAPSANRFGSVSPTRKEHVHAEFGDDLLVIDGGPARIGVESTIVDLSRGAPQLLRYGGVTREQLEEVLGREVALPDGSGPRAPGTLASHYAPRARVVLVPEGELWERVRERAQQVERATGQTEASPRLGVICRSSPPEPPPAHVEVCVLGTDVEQLARGLYAGLRELDELGCSEIWTVAPSPHGLGVAVGDRLRRAAADRPHRG